MVFRSIRQSVSIIADHFLANSLVASSLAITDVVVTNITATASQHLTIVAVTGKDIIAKLTDANGARKVLFKDSADETVASIDSNGVITGSSIVGPLTGNSTGTHTGPVAGDVTGDLTGVLNNHETGDTTGAPTNAELITAFGAVAEVANGIVGSFTDTHASGKTYIVINNGTAYDVVESTAAA